MKLRFLVFSLAAWSLFVVFGLKPDHLGLGGWNTDHNSHIDSAILFWYRGFEIYRKPVDPALVSTSPLARSMVARYGWPADAIYDLPERPGKPPLMINGPLIPCPYPPGMLLYSLPEAILKEAFGLSPKAAATLSLLKFLLAAHLLLWLFSVIFLERGAAEDGAKELIFYALLPAIYLETIAWALTGIFDAVALAAVLLCLNALRRKRGLESLFWYSTAALLHFRTLWYLPLFGRGLWLVWKNREYRLAGLRSHVMAVAATAMLGLSAYSFVLVYPALKGIGVRNYFFLDGDPSSLARLCYLLLPMALIGAALLKNRAWLLLACLAWSFTMICRTPQIQMWHSLYLLPLLAMTGFGERSAARSRLLALLAYIVMASLAFTRFPFSGALALDAVKELFG